MKQTIQKNRKNMLRNALGAGLVALGLTQEARGQDKKEDPRSEIKLDLRSAYLDKGRLYTQDLFTYIEGDATLKGMVETFPQSVKTNYGVDLQLPSFRLNAGFQDNSQPDSDLGRFSAAYSPQKDFSKSFIGGAFQYLPEGNRGIAIGGFDLSDKLHAEGTFDTEGDVRAAFFPKLNNATLGVGIGRNKEGDIDGNFSLNNEHIWANVKLGDRPFDGRLVFGTIDKDFSRYVSSVTGQGDNELDVYSDQTFKFDIADGFFDYFGVGHFVGKEPGDMALDLRFQEGNRAKAAVGYRVGDIGFMENASVTTGIYRDIANEVNGFNIQYNFDTGLFHDKSRATIGLRLDVNEARAMAGIFAGFKF